MNLNRNLRLIKFLLFPGNRKSELKLKVNLEYRRSLSEEHGVYEVDVENLINWDTINLKLISPTTTDGQISKLELLILAAFTKQLERGQNFLEIGTYDGNTTLNCAVNLCEGSKVFTIDLPEETKEDGELQYDDFLIKNPKRAQKKCAHLDNVQQFYANSLEFDFSKLDFNLAFIDGGHDYKTVKSDSENVLKYIKSPGIVLWHDYDVENPVGDLIHLLASKYKIARIKDTRICYLLIK